MEKTEKIFFICVAIAAAGILTFWIAGANGHKTMSATGFFIGGISAWVGLIALLIGECRHRNLYGY